MSGRGWRFIQPPIVDTRMQAHIFLADEKEPCGSGGGGRADGSVTRPLCDVVFHSFLLPHGWYRAREDVNGEVVGVMRRNTKCLALTEDARQVTVLDGNVLQVDVSA